MRRRLLTALLSALCLALPGLARAQAWPSQPIHLMVGSAPGGGTDAMARVVAEPLGRLLGQQVIVENRPGVSNTLAAGLTARATDGHTVLMGVVTGHAIAPHLLKLGFDSNRDLVPVAYVGAVPNVLVIGPSVQAASVQALIQLSKQQTGGMNYATSGTGSTQHIAAILFQDATGVSMSQVPYKGSGPALVDLIGGQVQLSFDTLPSVIGQIRSHQLRALAVSTAQRNPLLPEVPTSTCPPARPRRCRPGCTTRSTRCWRNPTPGPGSRPWGPKPGPSRRPNSPASTPRNTPASAP